MVGCTTAGEITSGAMWDRSIVAMTIASDYVDQLETAYIANAGDAKEIASAVAAIGEKLGEPVGSLDPGT